MTKKFNIKWKMIHNPGCFTCFSDQVGFWDTESSLTLELINRDLL